MQTLRIAQYGTKHGHGPDKLIALHNNPQVDLAGVYEPDPERRRSMQARPEFANLHWFENAEQMLSDSSIVAVASEGLNIESLDQSEQIIRAGKHLWYDKPAGCDWPQWQRVVALAQQQQLHLQMGFMFRYHNGFRQIAEWAKSGLLGEIYAVRAQMSTCIDEAQQKLIAVHKAGIFYDLASHMLDQIVWLLGRPHSVQGFFQQVQSRVENFQDNTHGVLCFDRALANIDISAIEAPPAARRFEVYGSLGSAIMEPFEPATQLRLCLKNAAQGYQTGAQLVPITAQSRQELYERELSAFLATIKQEQTPERSYQHDLLVQESLLRITGYLPNE